MPVRYERDDARRRLIVTVQGAFQTSKDCRLGRHGSEVVGAVQRSEAPDGLVRAVAFRGVPVPRQVAR